MLDKNKSGMIDKTEQEEAMKQIHSMTLPKARWTWSAMDTDGDGKISESEFQEGLRAISDKVGEEQLLDSIIRAWTDHPLALEKAKKAKEEEEALLAVLARVFLEHGEICQMTSDRYMGFDSDNNTADMADESLTTDK